MECSVNHKGICCFLLLDFIGYVLFRVFFGLSLIFTQGSLTCSHHPCISLPIPWAWMICLIVVCGQEPIHLISFAKTGAIYLPVLEKTSICSCWEGWEKQEYFNGRGFSIKTEGLGAGGRTHECVRQDLGDTSQGPKHHSLHTSERVGAGSQLQEGCCLPQRPQKGKRETQLKNRAC